MIEPRVVRIARPSRQTIGIFPRCEQCDRPLIRMQKRWCSQRCNAVLFNRRQRAALALDAYWSTK